ncbi:BatD family protein [Dysgonomonas reticulitermitis]
MNKLKHYSLQRLYILATLLLAFAIPVPAQENKVTIQAPEAVTVGEQFKIAYVVKSNKEVKESVIIKNMSGFEIVYGPSLSTSLSTTFKEGKRVQAYSASSTYILKALKKGKYTLPRGEVVIDGKRYKSDNFSIEVKDIGEMAKEIDNVDAFVRVIPSRSNVNLEDTLTVTYKLYTTKEISRILDTDFPYIDNFYASNISGRRQSFSEEKVGGKVYKVVEIRKMLLQPKKIGVITIPEGSVTVLYSAPTGRKVRDVWGDVYDETATTEKTLQMEPVTIRVHNLLSI